MPGKQILYFDRILKDDKWSFFLFFLIGVLFRIVFLLFQPTEGTQVDELALTFSLLDRWVGLPSCTLVWPGVPIQIVAAILLTPHFLLLIASDHSLLTLARGLVAWYADPSVPLTLLRLISVCAGAMTSALMFKTVSALTSNRQLGLFAFVLTMFLPVSLFQTLTGTTDASAVFFLALTAHAVFSPNRRPWAVGVCAAGALATKIIEVFWLFPLIAAYIYTSFEGRGFRDHVVYRELRSLVLAGAAGILFLIPWIWIDPLRFIKHIIGELLAKSGVVTPIAEVAAKDLGPGKFWLCVLFALCLLLAFQAGLSKRPDARLRFVVAIASAFPSLYFLINGVSYWRYLLGAEIPLTIVICQLMTEIRPRLRTVLAGMTAVAVTVLGITDQITYRSRPGVAALFSAADRACRFGSDVWLDNELLKHRAGSLLIPYDSVAEVAEYVGGRNQFEALNVRLKWAHVAPQAAKLLQPAFDESAREAATLWNALALAAPANTRCHYRLFDATPAEALQSGPPSVRITSFDVAAAARLIKSSSQPVLVIGKPDDVRSFGLSAFFFTSDHVWAISANASARKLLPPSVFAAFTGQSQQH